LRDLVRCREDAREDIQRERHRLLKFLLRQPKWRADALTHPAPSAAEVSGQQSQRGSPRRSSPLAAGRTASLDWGLGHESGATSATRLT
jgi:hypothetical protein